jgi:hypothetical protein
MRKFLILLFTLMCFTPAYAQTAEATLAVIENFLRQQLGRDYVLLEYNFEAATWQDSSLGCPEDGQTYIPGTINGYSWNFLTDDGIRYRVHSNLDGSQAVLCARMSEANLTYSTFSNNLFTIRHPNLWTAQRSGESEVSYAFRGQLGCNLPGAAVYVVVNPGNAEAVLESYLSNTSTEGRINAPFGLTGSQTVYTTPCNEFQRKWQATALTDQNNAYLIVQWSPENLYPIWKPVFGEMLNSFTAVSGSVVVQPANVAAPTTAANPATAEASPITPMPTEVAAMVPMPPAAPVIDLTTIPFIHVFLGDIHIGRLNNLPGIPLTQDEISAKTHILPSPNGQQVAFIQDETSLYSFSLVETRGIQRISEKTARGFPPAWSPDGTQLAYMRDTGASSSEGVIQLEIVVNENVLGRLSFTANCDTTLRYQVDRLYAKETGFQGNNLMFAWLFGDRFVYTPNCTGQGLKIWNAEQETDLGENLRRAQLAPDLNRIAAISDEGIVVIDLSTLEQIVIPTIAPPDQLGWDITGTQIYYSTLTAAGPTVFDDASRQTELEPILGVFPFESRLNTVRLYQIDINNHAEVQRWEGQNGFAIGRIQGLPDGSGVLFTYVPSDRVFLAAVINGEDPAKIFQSIPQTQLFFLPTDSTTAQPLAYTAQPILAVPLVTLRN